MPAEDPKTMGQNSVPPPEGGPQTQDDLKGATVPTDEQKKAYERKVEESKERRDS